MRIITYQEIEEINNLLSQGKDCKFIGKKLGFSPYTISKYVGNFEEKNKIKFNEPLPEFNPTIFHNKDWGELCVLTDKEIEELRKLWEEMDF